MRRLAFCIVLFACGARSSLDDESVGDASTVEGDVADTSVVIGGHRDEVGLAVGFDWICVYRPAGKSGCTGTLASQDDAATIKLPEHMWNMRGTTPYGDVACGMTLNGLSCWGAKASLPLGCKDVTPLESYIPSKSCQPTIIADRDFGQVAPPWFIDANGSLLGLLGGALGALPQPKPLRAVAFPYPLPGGPFGVDFDGHVVAWDAACTSDCASTIIETGLAPVGIAANRHGTCVWDAAGRLSCWGDPVMVGGTTPHLIAVPPVRDVVARTSSMCSLGQDGSVTCFGCTKTEPCAAANGYWWGDYLWALTTSPQTISFPRPAIAFASSFRTCAVLDDLTVWCMGPYPEDPDGGLGDTTPTHVTALDP